jgi:hypothetical protein
VLAARADKSEEHHRGENREPGDHMTLKTIVGPNQALHDYLSLGERRSLRKLARHYASTMPTGAPPLITIKSWSKRYGWVEKAGQHDREVAETLALRVKEAAITAEFDRVQALAKVARQCLEDASRVRLSGAATASELRILVTTAIDAIKMVEVLTGGASDRTEERASGLQEQARQLLAELEARKRAEGARALLTAPE